MPAAARIDRATDRISVSTIASTPVFRLPRDCSCQDAWFEMRPEALDMDVALIDASEGSMPLVIKRDPAWRQDPREVRAHAETAPAACRVSPDEPLRRVLGQLAHRRYLLCTDGEAVTGIVTTTDLYKPGARLVALEILLDVEDAITLLFPSLTNRRWREHLTDAQRESLQVAIEKRKAQGSYNSDEDCLYLSHKLTIARKVIPASLGMSHAEWRRRTGPMIGMRNDLSHGRALSSSLASALDVPGQLAQLDELRHQLWRHVDERADVWDKYARTECLVRLDGELLPIARIRSKLPPRFWMLSAQNPYERVLSDPVNAQRHQALVQDLERRGACLAEGTGRAPGDEAWEEDMAVAQGIDRKTACEISRRYGQRSAFEFEGEVFRVVEVANGEVRHEGPIDPPGG